MKDLRVETHFKNAVLYRALMERYEQTGYEVNRSPLGRGGVPLVKFASEYTGLTRATISQYLNLALAPVHTAKNREGVRRRSAITLAEKLEVPFEDLFPTSLYALALQLPAKVVREYESSQVMLSIGEARSMHLLTPVPMEKVLELELEDMRRDLEAMLDTLPFPKQAQVLRMRFGLPPWDHEHSQKEIGEHFCLTGERIRQIESRALRCLRSPSRRGVLERHIIQHALSSQPLLLEDRGTIEPQE